MGGTCAAHFDSSTTSGFGRREASLPKLAIAHTHLFRLNLKHESTRISPIRPPLLVPVLSVASTEQLSSSKRRAHMDDYMFDIVDRLDRGDLPIHPYSTQHRDFQRAAEIQNHVIYPNFDDMQLSHHYRYDNPPPAPLKHHDVSADTTEYDSFGKPSDHANVW